MTQASAVCDARAQAPAGGGGVVAPASPFRLLRSISGSRYEIKNGRLTVLDPRTAFRVPEDGKIIVYFEWLGPAGKHQLVGTWRGPANTSTTSAFEYVAKESNFSAYWELDLPATAPRGQWSLEATIDGHPAGVHAFDVGGADSPAPVVTPTRAPLTRQEVFARTLAASVIVEAVDREGTRIATGPGVAIDRTTIATSFAVLNNAVRLRVRGRDGATIETDKVASWNRRQDWALIPVTALNGVEPPPHATAAVQPGEACYSAGVADGTVTVASGEIVGVAPGSASGPRINVSFFTAGGSPGAPLLNEYGELTGMMTEGLSEQTVSRTMLRLGQISDVPGVTAVPVAVLAAAPPASSPTPLTVLGERGLFTPPVTLGRHVLSGGFATSVPARGQSTQPVDQRYEFVPSDKTMTVFVTWNPVDRLKGAATIRMYDLDNRALGESKPLKLSLRTGQMMMSTWGINVPAPGVYRVDALVDGVIAWRGHFLVKD